MTTTPDPMDLTEAEELLRRAVVEGWAAGQASAIAALTPPTTADVLAAVDAFVMDGSWQEWPEYVSRDVVRKLLLAWETEGRPT